MSESERRVPAPFRWSSDDVHEWLRDAERLIEEMRVVSDDAQIAWIRALLEEEVQRKRTQLAGSSD